MNAGLSTQYKNIKNDFFTFIRRNLPSEDKMYHYGLLTASFWTSSTLMQRGFGAIGIHGGRSANVLFASGLLSAISCIVLSLSIAEAVFPVSSKLKPRQARINLIQNTLVGLSAFALLEGRLFRTLLPSSVIAPGVFSPLAFKNMRSIPTIDPVATASQRLRIQKFGRRFGCHHCGTRQLFSGASYIADHMPPTKIVLDINKKWWRRLLGMKVRMLPYVIVIAHSTHFLHLQITQRLYPQCQSCFMLQGAAVRTNSHVLAYHNSLKLNHFAPALALILIDSNPDIKSFFARIAKDLYEDGQDLNRLAGKLWKLQDRFR